MNRSGAPEAVRAEFAGGITGRVTGTCAGRMRTDPPFRTPVTGPVRALGHAQIRNSVGRLGDLETSILSDPMHAGK